MGGEGGVLRSVALGAWCYLLGGEGRGGEKAGFAELVEVEDRKYGIFPLTKGESDRDVLFVDPR